MSSLVRTVEVRFQHRVYFTRGVFEQPNRLLRDVLAASQKPMASRVLVVVDAGLARARPGVKREIARYFAAHRGLLELVEPPCLVPGGEAVKEGWGHVSAIHERIHRGHLDRQSFVLAVGGGALLDMVGLAAATAHRGCRHVRLPTTTLSQADSGVGIKNAVNLFGQKNFVGTFAPPFAVINDFAWLDTLSPRDQRAGWVEAVKVALVRDRRFFAEIERRVADLRRFDRRTTEWVIRRCARLHVDHIATGGDPFEMGSARPLDFGHWSAHKLESLSGYRLRHGEAVAVGIALDTLYSNRRGYLSGPETERVLSVLLRLGFRLFAPELVRRDARGRWVILTGLEEFREHLGGRLTLTLLRRIGQGFEVHEMDPETLREVLGEMRRRAVGSGFDRRRS